MFAKAFVNFYELVHGRLHLPGAGAVVRKAARYLPALRAYPYTLPGVGATILDSRDISSYGL